MATRHSSLGSVLTDLGDLAGTRTDHKRALELGQTTVRLNHPRWPPFTTTPDHAPSVRWDRDAGRWFAFVLLAWAVVCCNRL